MSELGAVLVTAFVVPPLRTVVTSAVRAAKRVAAVTTSGALQLELAAERRLMDPGPPRGSVRG
jgi:hypothetical protein